jgi:hypothetical protein
VNFFSFMSCLCKKLEDCEAFRTKLRHKRNVVYSKGTHHSAPAGYGTRKSLSIAILGTVLKEQISGTNKAFFFFFGTLLLLYGALAAPLRLEAHEELRGQVFSEGLIKHLEEPS